VTETLADTSRAAPLDRFWIRSALGLLAGLGVCFALPPWGWWPLAPLGVALWAYLLDRANWKERFWVGAFAAWGWFVPSWLWMASFSFVGWPIGVAIFFPVVYGAVSALTPPGRFRFLALAGWLVLVDWFRWHAPFGGIPISMLATTQGSGPLLPGARIVSSLGVSATVAFAGASLGALAARRWIGGAVGLVLVAAVTIAGVFAPEGTVVDTIDIAVVQGGGEQGTRAADSDSALVFTRHLEASESIEEPVDLILWPENVVNLVEYEGSFQQQQLEELAIRYDATLVVGIVEDAGPEHFLNAVIVIGPDGEQIGRFDKVRRVPFGEYTPLRSLMEVFAEDQLPPKDQIVGTESPTIDTPAGNLGFAISYEIFFPRRTRATLADGSEIILNPTNGSSYWLTQIQTQQLASSKLRAVESGRWVVQAAPTGFSGFVDPAGNLFDQTEISERAVLHKTVELRDGDTWAFTLGNTPAIFAGAAAVIGAWLLARREVDDYPPTAEI